MQRCKRTHVFKDTPSNDWSATADGDILRDWLLLSFLSALATHWRLSEMSFKFSKTCLDGSPHWGNMQEFNQKTVWWPKTKICNRIEYKVKESLKKNKSLIRRRKRFCLFAAFSFVQRTFLLEINSENRMWDYLSLHRFTAVTWMEDDSFQDESCHKHTQTTCRFG